MIAKIGVQDAFVTQSLGSTAYTNPHNLHPEASAWIDRYSDLTTQTPVTSPAVQNGLAIARPEPASLAVPESTSGSPMIRLRWREGAAIIGAILMIGGASGILPSCKDSDGPQSSISLKVEEPDPCQGYAQLCYIRAESDILAYIRSGVTYPDHLLSPIAELRSNALRFSDYIEQQFRLISAQRFLDIKDPSNLLQGYQLIKNGTIKPAKLTEDVFMKGLKSSLVCYDYTNMNKCIYCGSKDTYCDSSIPISRRIKRFSAIKPVKLDYARLRLIEAYFVSYLNAVNFYREGVVSLQDSAILMDEDPVAYVLSSKLEELLAYPKKLQTAYKILRFEYRENQKLQAQTRSTNALIRSNRKFIAQVRRMLDGYERYMAQWKRYSSALDSRLSSIDLKPNPVDVQSIRVNIPSFDINAGLGALPTPGLPASARTGFIRLSLTPRPTFVKMTQRQRLFRYRMECIRRGSANVIFNTLQ